MTQESRERRLVAADLITDARLDNAEADAFRHREIAGRVAELAATTRTPCNIALYGPWGSGKSSFCHLLTDAVAEQSVSAKVIRYDAWKFGGHALKRNFISNAAGELGIDTSPTRRAKSDFHGGLHQSTSSVALRPDQLWKGGTALSLLSYAALAAVAAVLISLGWGGIETLVNNDVSFGAAFKSALRPIGTALLTAAGAVGLGVKIFETASVTVDQKAPSEDDQFDELFRRLVAAGRKKSGHDTLVFFIDELDRCSKSDVVTTLTSLRTFLDQPHCVFIVAADREVLEEALGALEQETPVRADEPYYSSASAFLDKIFQYQFTLPPLRSGRLTGFGRSLVIGNTSGLWAELRKHDDAQTFDAVLYTLIPPHVRSPRRVKVLLNSFATNIRVAEARGVAWIDRATEIAKLTVLQVEFPVIAADLHLEPNLPTLLIKPPPEPTKRQAMLLHRHGDPSGAQPQTSTDSGEPAETPQETEGESNGVAPPDRLLAGAGSARLRERQYDDLVRYLESRALAPDPGRDLVYLEIAGAVVGIEDPELGALIEDTAATSPDEVIGALEGRGEAELIAVAKALGRQSENEFGPEQQNVINALTGVASTIDIAVLRDDPGDLAKQLRSYRRARGEFDHDQLAGVLTIGVAAGSDGIDLVKAAIDTPGFFEDEDNVEVAAQTLSYLDDDAAASVAGAIAELAVERPDIAEGVVRRESAPTVERFLGDAEESLIEAFTVEPAEAPKPPAGSAAATPAVPADAPEPPDSGDLVGSLLTILLERGEAFTGMAVAFATTMLRRRVPGSFQPISGMKREVAEAAPTAEARDSFALEGLAWVNPTGWSQWLSLLSDTSGSATEAAAAAQTILRRSWKSQNANAAKARQAASETLDKVLSGRTSSDTLSDEAWDPIIAALGGPIDLTDEQVVDDRALLFAVADVAIKHDQSGDLTERLSSGVVSGLSVAVPASFTLDDATSARLVGLITQMPATALGEMYHVWAKALTDDAVATSPHYCRVELALAAQLTQRTDERVEVRANAITNVVTSSFAAEAISAWLSTDPAYADVTRVLRQLSSAAAVRGTRQAVGDWAAHLTEDERTSAAKALMEPSRAGTLDPLVSEIASRGVDRVDVARHLVGEMSSAGSQPARQRVVEIVKLLGFSTYEETRPLAEQSSTMLEVAESKAAVEDAARLLTVIGNNHRMKAVIQAQVRALDGRERLNNGAKRAFESAGYQVPKKKRSGALGIIDRITGG